MRKLFFNLFVIFSICIGQSALAESGKIVGWGSQVVGADLSGGFVAIAAGGYRSLGLKEDGSIVAWGANGSGQCDVPFPNSGFIAVAAGGAHSLGLKEDGSIVAWGHNLSGQCDVPSPNSGFIAVAAGNAHSLAIRKMGPPPPAKLRLIIDTDPAVGDSDPDDGTAIIYAFQSPNLCTVEAITYGFGNFGNQIVEPNGVTRGANRMLDYYELQICKLLEVLEEAGAITPFPREKIFRCHKMSETWDNYGCPGNLTEASEFLRYAVSENPGQYTIIALGTLTNIATAMAHYPDGYPGDPNAFLRDCKNLWVVGGGIDKGNVLQCVGLDDCLMITAEFNIWRDKAAAEYVFSHAVEVNGEPKIKMVPLNATMRWLINNSGIDDMNNTNTRITNYLNFPLRWWILEQNPWDNRQFSGIENYAISFARNVNAGNPFHAGLAARPLPWTPAFPPYDTIGVALALEPNLAGWAWDNQKVRVNLVSGATEVVDDPCRARVHILYDYNDTDMAQRIVDRWRETTHHQPPENKCFLECSNADYVIQYGVPSVGYAGPRDVNLDATEYRILPTDPLPVYVDYYYHLPVGVAPYMLDLYAKYRGRMIFDVNLPNDASVTEVKLHVYCDRKKDWFDIDHRVNIYSSDPFIQSALVLWNNAVEMNKYVGPNDIGTLPAWRAIDLGPKAVNDLQYTINGGGDKFAIFLVEDGDDHPCSWFDTSKDWKAYLEVDYDIVDSVDFKDLEELVSYWLSVCSGPDWCAGYDFNQSCRVDFADFAEFAEHWLEGTTP